MRHRLLILALALGLAHPAPAQVVQPGQVAPTAEAEAKALVLAAGLRDQLLNGMPAMAEGLRQHLNQQNPGREDDVRRAVETAIVPTVTERLDELIALGVQPLVRGFTAEELYIMRRFLELNLDQRMEGALQLVSFELDRESGEWLRKIAEQALAARASDQSLRGLRF
ncbi:hypothetical protein [Elioraea sp.]|jgi:hypothetical protein|uniref:hypothetical protein n=1 Tax=Elioraea sp. TaxID=2185103 RepID=UPI003F7144D3